MFIKSVIRFSEFIAESVIIASVVVFSLRLFFRFACLLASRPWRRYRTFTLHRRRWRKPTAEERHSSPYCTICLEDAAEGDQMRRITACSHCFHADCIDPWLEKKSTCPQCRAEIPPVPPGNPLLALFVPPGVIDLFTKGTVSDAEPNRRTKSGSPRRAGMWFHTMYRFNQSLGLSWSISRNNRGFIFTRNHRC